MISLESSNTSAFQKILSFPDTHRSRRDIRTYQESRNTSAFQKTISFPETSRTRQNTKNRSLLDGCYSPIIEDYPNLTPKYIDECKTINDSHNYYDSNFLIELLKKYSEVNNKLNENVLKQINNEKAIFFGLNDIYKYLSLHIKENSSSSTSSPTSSSTFSLSKLFSCSSSKNTID
ncbi:uncharacterized protein LOC126907141 [Daktulosphaira vitifoliae]|uniref:uncharacterized protein LOC126907141 n=1 Tax=Daktulosphaira vitifoliae TaxID=58002 RepID=UPI0021A9E85D|nr:uncharacterized protein LOC126907141 [Daktulosphaira vitifoliae]